MQGGCKSGSHPGEAKHEKRGQGTGVIWEKIMRNKCAVMEWEKVDEMSQELKACTAQRGVGEWGGDNTIGTEKRGAVFRNRRKWLKRGKNKKGMNYWNETRMKSWQETPLFQLLQFHSYITWNETRMNSEVSFFSHFPPPWTFTVHFNPLLILVKLTINIRPSWSHMNKYNDHFQSFKILKSIWYWP